MPVYPKETSPIINFLDIVNYLKYTLDSLLKQDMLNHSNNDIKLLIKHGVKLPLATKNYPSRGQTSVQELYQTDVGKLFLKRVSERNHIECQVDAKTGSLAEREFWAFRLAEKIGDLLDLYRSKK